MNGKKIGWQKYRFSPERPKQDNDFMSIYAYVHHKSLIDEIGNFKNELNNLDVAKEFIAMQCAAHSSFYIPLHVVEVDDDDASHSFLNNCTKAQNSCMSESHDSTNKIVCYTCITNDYDKLKMPCIMPKNIDFICFADYDEDFCNGWRIRKIPDELKSYSHVKQQRLVKTSAHRWLSEYEVSIWIDGNICVKKDLNILVKQCNLVDNDFYVRRHLFRSCIYDEADECIRKGKDSSDVISD